MIPPSTESRPNRRAPWPRWSEEVPSRRRDLNRSVAAGLSVTVLFHLLLLLAVPWDRIAVVEVDPPAANPPMEVEFVTLPRFVETNPERDPQRPEDTENIAAQDQVAAQEVPDPLSDSDTPTVDGELEDSPKIVDGAMAEPSPPAPPDVPEPTMPQEAPVAQAEPESVVATAPEQAPEVLEAPAPSPVLPTDEDQGLVPVESEAETIAQAESQEPAERVAAPEEAAEVDDGKVTMVEVAQQASETGQPVPRPRPQINFRVPSGPLVQNQRAASRMGAIGIDANFSEFGAYQQRMIEAISAQWQLLGNQARYTGADMGTNCVVEFVLNRRGEVTNLTVRHSSASSAGTIMTVEAIRGVAPFGPWTQDMVRVLGEEQTVRINFIYR